MAYTCFRAMRVVAPTAQQSMDVFAALLRDQHKDAELASYTLCKDKWLLLIG